METWEKFMVANTVLCIGILLYIFVPWQSIALRFHPADPDALTAPVLVNSNDGKWQLEASHQAKVSLHALEPGNPKNILSTITYSNPRREQWDYQKLPAEVMRAAFSPKSQYAIVAWDWYIPKYSPLQLQLIDLRTKKSYFLPGFNDTNSEIMPVWSKKERYLAVSGGQFIRLWDVKHLDKVKLIGPITYKNLRVDNGYNLVFTNNDSYLKVNYQIYDQKANAFLYDYLEATFSTSEGKLTSTELIHGTKPPAE